MYLDICSNLIIEKISIVIKLKNDYTKDLRELWANCTRNNKILFKKNKKKDKFKMEKITIVILT